MLVSLARSQSWQTASHSSSGEVEGVVRAAGEQGPRREGRLSRCSSRGQPVGNVSEHSEKMTHLHSALGLGPPRCSVANGLGGAGCAPRDQALSGASESKGRTVMMRSSLVKLGIPACLKSPGRGQSALERGSSAEPQPESEG